LADQIDGSRGQSSGARHAGLVDVGLRTANAGRAGLPLAPWSWVTPFWLADPQAQRVERVLVVDGRVNLDIRTVGLAVDDRVRLASRLAGMVLHSTGVANPVEFRGSPLGGR
jgi:hypothetical protein